MATASLQPDTVTKEPEPVAQDVLIVPSSPFFVRSLDLPQGIRRDEIDSFVEVTLEEISPFGLNQVYWGYYLPEGADRILVYAAYRRSLDSLASEESWKEATLVVPAFAAALGLKKTGVRAVFLKNLHEVTMVYWGATGKVPAVVASRRFNPEEAGAAEAARRALLERAEISESPETVAFEAPEVAAFHNKTLVFDLRGEGAGKTERAEIHGAAVWALDVRDKDFLVAKHKELRQNRWVWNGALGLVGLFVLLAILEVGLIAGSRVLANRAEAVEQRAPLVAQIEQQSELANLLEDLDGRRLLPFEMLGYINRLRPGSIEFERVSTAGTLGMEAEALTSNSADVSRYAELLEDSPALESAEIRNLRSRDGGRYTFTLAVRFREGELTGRMQQVDTQEPAEEPDELPLDPPAAPGSGAEPEVARPGLEEDPRI